MKFYICNLGCKVNTYESNVMSEELKRKGLVETTPENAEIVVVNTSCVTDVALKKSLKMIRRYKGKIIVVTGCASQLKSDLIKDIEDVKIILGNVGKSKIYDYIEEYLKTKKQIIEIKNINEEPFENMMLDNFN